MNRLSEVVTYQVFSPIADELNKRGMGEIRGLSSFSSKNTNSTQAEISKGMNMTMPNRRSCRFQT